MKKKILFFIESLNGGGAEKVLTDIVRILDSSKYQIDVCTVSDNGVYQKTIEKYANYRPLIRSRWYEKGGVGKILYWICYRSIYNLPTSLIYRFCIHEKYDTEVAFVEGFSTKFIASSCNRSSKKYAWVHTDMEKNSYAAKFYRNHSHELETYRKFDKICCVSASVRKVFDRMFFTDDKVIVQYNPIDNLAIQQKSNETIELSPNKTLQLGTIGRLEKQKGYVRLVSMLGDLHQKGYDFGLWILGEGSERQCLEEIIGKYNMEGKIRLLGFQENPYKYLKRCDAFVCSSYAEGFSTAATEALILGKPVFTTDCAGMQELFGQYKCGEIVENTDEALYRMLENLVSGKWKPEDYGCDAEKRAADFDIHVRMKEIERLLDS